MFSREFTELFFIGAVVGAISYAHTRLPDLVSFLTFVIIIWASFKMLYYLFESLWCLHRASLIDQPYHRFLVLMAYNMFEATLSFAADFFSLEQIQPDSLSGIVSSKNTTEIAFDCIFFSLLNFSFFGFGDVTPATVPAKLIVMMEVVCGFVTVIFLLSDFVSIKQSILSDRVRHK